MFEGNWTDPFHVHFLFLDLFCSLNCGSTRLILPVGGFSIFLFSRTCITDSPRQAIFIFRDRSRPFARTSSFMSAFLLVVPPVNLSPFSFF